MKWHIKGLAALLMGLGLSVSAQDSGSETTENELPSSGAENQTIDIPDLLSLSEALSLANQQHPDLLSARAKQSAADAAIAASQSGQGWRASLNLEGRYADRADDGANDYIDDSRYELKISKLLSDFGQSAASATAAQLAVDSSALNLAYTERLRRIDVMAKYLDVVAADFKYAADNEAMTLAFFPWNRARERREMFDSESEVTVLKLQSAYLKVLAKRNKTQRQQRKSRFRLASAMGWPDAKPVSVIEPDLSAYARPLPDYDELLQSAIEKSPVLARLKLERDALATKVQGAEQRIKPRLSMNLYASEWEHRYTSKDANRAVLQLEIPLLDGGSQQSTVAQSNALLFAKDAEIGRYQHQLREQIIDWVQKLEGLEAALADHDVDMSYRERALDRARLLYEMEVRTQIGRAMGDMAQTIYDGAKARFERAIIWEQIDAMLGASPVEIKS